MGKRANRDALRQLVMVSRVVDDDEPSAAARPPAPKLGQDDPVTRLLYARINLSAARAAMTSTEETLARIEGGHLRGCAEITESSKVLQSVQSDVVAMFRAQQSSNHEALLAAEQEYAAAKAAHDAAYPITARKRSKVL